MGGLFITFEGPDGSGKTTQMRRLGARLQHTGMKVVMTREPGGTSIGDRIRELVLSPHYDTMADETEVLLYAASRAQHVREVILPALRDGCVVICDRFIDASLAYQGYGLGQLPEQIASISHYASSGLQPRRTYMLDVPTEISRQRLLSRAQDAGHEGLDRIERKEQQYHERVRQGFLTIASSEPHRVLLINANRKEEDIARDINEDCDRLLAATFAQ